MNKVTLGMGLALALCLSTNGLDAKAQVLKGKTLAIAGTDTIPSKKGDPEGVSGMACLGAASDTKRPCVLVNDEEKALRLVELDKGTLQFSGGKIRLTHDKDAGEGVVGTPINPQCKDDKGNVSAGKYDEFDGEGVSLAGGYLYVTGSHSCSRSGKYLRSAYMIARITTGANGVDSSAKLERSWRVADMLKASNASAAYGADRDNGTNIEGLAVHGGTAYVGLRTPLIDKKALLISASAEALFAPGAAPLAPETIKNYALALGDGAGIRDLAALSNGDLLVLSGPTLEQDGVPYALWRYTPSSNGLVTLGELEGRKNDKGKTAKAETVVILDEAKDGKALKVLVAYDNASNGMPITLDVPLP